MILSIGYEDRTPAEILAIAERLDAVVVDVRSNAAFRCKRGFLRKDLEALLGARYEYRGATLGGRKAIAPESIEQLAHGHKGRRLMLMCQEAAPGDCHRHHAIALPLLALGVDVHHVCDDEVFAASALAEAMRLDEADGGDHAYDYVDFEAFARSITSSSASPS